MLTPPLGSEAVALKCACREALGEDTSSVHPMALPGWSRSYVHFQTRMLQVPNVHVCRRDPREGDPSSHGCGETAAGGRIRRQEWSATQVGGKLRPAESPRILILTASRSLANYGPAKIEEVVPVRDQMAWYVGTTCCWNVGLRVDLQVRFGSPIQHVDPPRRSDREGVYQACATVRRS